MNSHQKIIDDHYGGDVKRFDDAYAEAIVEGRRHMVQWNDLVTAAITLRCPNFYCSGDPVESV